jgi:hypothetical protein
MKSITITFEPQILKNTVRPVLKTEGFGGVVSTYPFDRDEFFSALRIARDHMIERIEEMELDDRIAREDAAGASK